jgi:SAM-dependent methyltransferase
MSLDIAQLDEHFHDESFDLIVSTLVFSELNDVERIFVLKQVRRLLKPAGKVFIGDEVIPDDILSMIFYYIIRIQNSIYNGWLRRIRLERSQRIL